MRRLVTDEDREGLDVVQLGKDLGRPVARRATGRHQDDRFTGPGDEVLLVRPLLDVRRESDLLGPLEEWAHEQYFITRPGEPVVLVAPSGASSDRAAEILSELNYIEALPVFVGDQAPPLPALLLPVAAGIGEELSPVLASIPLSQIGLHLMRLYGKRSYNFPDDEARREHYDTIHRVTIGDPA